MTDHPPATGDKLADYLARLKAAGAARAAVNAEVKALIRDAPPEVPIAELAQLAGVSRPTIYKWQGKA